MVGYPEAIPAGLLGVVSEVVDTGHRSTRGQRDDPGGQWSDVLPEHDGRTGDLGELRVIGHGPGPSKELLGGLEHRDDRARPRRA